MLHILSKQPNNNGVSLSKFLIFCFFLLFSVHCSKGKKNGLGLGILLLAGGGDSSSSSSDNATNSVNPKQPGGGGNGGDDPNNAPEFDEVKQKIEKNIKFPTGNENKILSSNSDYQSVDFSITGDFFQELGKLEKLSLEHSVSAGSKKTDPTKIDITQPFLTAKKIPLTYDLSSLQPENGFAQTKLKLKFSSNDKQIIQKEWTQNLFLQGTEQIPLLSYLNTSDRYVLVPTNNTVIAGNFKIQSPPNQNASQFKVRIPDDLGLSDQFETRIEVINLKWNSGGHNNTWSPTFDVPNQSVGESLEVPILLPRKDSTTLASQLFYRLKRGNKTWIPTPVFKNYYFIKNNNDVNYFETELSSLLIKKGEKFKLSVKIPANRGYANIDQILLSFFEEEDTKFVTIYRVTKDGVTQKNNSPRYADKINSFFSSVTNEQEGEKFASNKRFTMLIDFKDNLEETILFKIMLRGSGVAGFPNLEENFNLRLNTDKN